MKKSSNSTEAAILLARKQITIYVVVGIILAVCAPVRATVTTLADLLNGATITSGDKLFSNFSNYSSTGSYFAHPVNPADINVSPYFDSTYSEFGLLFQPTKFTTFFVHGDGLQSTSFEYDVSSTQVNYLISDNTLTMVGRIIGGSGGGYVTVTEMAKSWPSEMLLTTKETYVTEFGVVDSEHVVYPTSVPTVHVYTSVSLMCNFSAGSCVMNRFIETFSQVPEPTMLSLLGIGAMMLRRKQS